MIENTGYNRRLAQWRVTWLNEHSTSHQLLWLNESYVLRNPPLRQAPNRCKQWERKFRTNENDRREQPTLTKLKKTDN